LHSNKVLVLVLQLALLLLAYPLVLQLLLWLVWLWHLLCPLTRLILCTPPQTLAQALCKFVSPTANQLSLI
jgi:hypothetical protein